MDPTISAENIDLMVIGAGPAGLSTTLHLLKLDPSFSKRMLLLEKASHPRPKLCGGGLTRFGIEALRSLELEWPLPIPQVTIEEARLVYDKRTIYVHAKPEIVIFERAELDAYLARQARHRGVVIHEREKALTLTPTRNGFEVITDQATYHAQVVVGADGAKGVARQYLQRTLKSPPRVARALEVFSPAPLFTPHLNQHYAFFDFTPTRHQLQGYYWEFPVRLADEAACNFGIYDARIARRRPRAKLPRLLQQNIAASEIQVELAQFAGHPIHWFSPRSCFSQPHLLLVGDAAGVDPLFGEGIAPALAYGEIAATAILQAFTRNDFSFRHYRKMLLSSPLGRYLLLRWSIAWWGYRLSGSPLFMHFIWTIGNLINRLWPAPPVLPSPP